MNRYLLDTNIISLLLRRDANADARYRSELWNQSEFLLSALVEYETRRGLRWRNAVTLERKYDVLVSGFRYLALERATWEQAADLWVASRQNARPLPDADLLIAAHAIETGAVLVTNNQKHFKPFVPLGLQIEDWTK